MTEMKAKGDTRAHASSSDPRDGSLLLRAPHPSELGSFRKETVEALDLSLDGLLYPKSSDDEEEEEEEEDEAKAYLPPEEGSAKGNSSSIRASCGSPADKDALDRVLDTFLAPSSSPANSGSPPAAWSFFGSEIAEFPGALMNRRAPDGKASDAPANATPLLPLSPTAPSSSPWKAAKDADGAVFRSPRAKEAAPADASKGEPAFALRDPSESDGASDSGANSLVAAAPSGRVPGAAASAAGDFQPGLKIKEESLGGAVAGPPPAPHGDGGAYLGGKSSPLAVAISCADYAPPLPKTPGGGGGHHEASSSSSSLESVLYKAEVAAAAAAGGSYGPAPCKASTSCIVPRDSLSLPSTSSTAPAALYQPLALHGPQQLALPPTGIKDGFPQLYPPYLSYIRSDAEAGQSPQYTFESLPQKICLICGDEASGCHYGVLTCGSCKVFFKRAMEGQHNYLCAGRNDCIVDKIRRKNCPACRLRKCCQAGMVLGGRKFKKFNKVKVLRTLDVIALQQPAAHPTDSQALAQRLSFSPSQEIQYIPPLVSILQGIEPEVVYAGYDNTQPETPSALLTGLNQLCERQLLCVVKWSKSLPGFRNLHIDDQITLIQYSWMSLMVFAMGWRSYKHVSGQMLYFAPDLILNEQRMKESSFYSQCLSMWQIPQEFVKLQVSQEEFLCMKALLLLSTIPLEGLRSQNQFEEMRSSYIRELVKAIGLRQKGVVASSQRFYQLTKLMDSMHDLVKQLHLYCLNTFLQSRALSVEFPEMMSEVIAAQLPKILAGMVKPLLFHKK
ncbi:PREDICTED: progesterone receptor-like [Gekko japonicus]|uniref:Progesterone receptor n=1 Tax=Gekko japonicus TaxID=146911 RepID=A0ABM1LEZ6_GEKJA|nr:PREDICTED: progesterone receptor-like [Gekko japonicus]